MMPKILFIIFSNLNFFMSVPYIPFVEAIFESFEITCLNHQFFLSVFLRVFWRLLRIPVNVSQWRMKIGNFHNSSSNSLCDCVFCLSKSLMVIVYISYAVLFKDIANLTFVFANFLTVFRKRVNIINIYLGRILY